MKHNKQKHRTISTIIYGLIVCLLLCLYPGSVMAEEAIPDAEEVVDETADAEAISRIKTNEEITVEVINGLWGSGEERRQNLEANGYDPDVIQSLVDTNYDPSIGVFVAIVFDSAYGTVPEPLITSVGALAERPEDPYAEGYLFQGWYTDPEYTTEYNFDTPIEESVVIYAKWEEEDQTPPTVTVTFLNTDDNSTTETIVDTGATVSKPYPQAKEGYVFDGWYTDAEYTTEYDFETGVEADMTLYTKFRPSKYTIFYDGNSAEGERIEQSIDYDSTAYVLDNSFVKEGYNFIGWNNKPDGSGRAFAVNDEIRNLVPEDGAKITLYAQWEEPYQVKEGNGQNIAVGNEANFIINANIQQLTEITVDSKEIPATAYTGWSNDEGMYITLNPVFTKILPDGQHTIQFVLQDGICEAEFTVTGNDVQESSGIPIWMIAGGAGIIIAGLLIFLFLYKKRKSDY